MSSQYRNPEFASEAPTRYDASEAMRQPAQLAYAEARSAYQGDVNLGSLPSMQFEERPAHHHFHHPVHHYHHRRHGEVAISHSRHEHYQHYEHHHRPIHHHDYRHAEHAAVHVGYSGHHRYQAEAPHASDRNVVLDANSATSRESHFAFGPVSDSVRAMENKLAQIALHVAHRLGTVGNCAYGPRLAFDKLGFHLRPAVATEQGDQIMTASNGGNKLFERVSAADARPGDYGVRDWSNSVQRANHHQNKGDAFIVTGRERNGALTAANDHTFVVPADGGRYKNLTFWRPTEEFVRLYGENA